jgi:hypothetical protein
MKRKLTAWILSVIMILGIVPMTAFAHEIDVEPPFEQEQVWPILPAEESAVPSGGVLNGNDLTILAGTTFKLTAAGSVTWASDDISFAAVGNDGTIAAIDEGVATVTAYNSSGTVLATFNVKVESPESVNAALGKYVTAYNTGNNPTNPAVPLGTLSEQNVTNGKIVPRELRGAAGNANSATLTEVAGATWWSANSPRANARWLVIDLGEKLPI